MKPGELRYNPMRDDEYIRVRGLPDEDLIKEGLAHKDWLVRELANRYDVVVEKLEAQ